MQVSNVIQLKRSYASKAMLCKYDVTQLELKSTQKCFSFAIILNDKNFCHDP